MDINGFKIDINSEDSIVLKTEKIKKDYFLVYIYDLFYNCFNFYKCLCSCFTFIFMDRKLEGIYNIRTYLLNMLMHQSCDILNPELILHTTTVLNLQSDSRRVCLIIQLGALKNFQKVKEIITELKIHNYPVYIVPETPKVGDLVRIFVGPYFSEENLECCLNDLYRLTSLVGRVHIYQVKD